MPTYEAATAIIYNGISENLHDINSEIHSSDLRLFLIKKTKGDESHKRRTSVNLTNTVSVLKILGDNGGRRYETK